MLVSTRGGGAVPASSAILRGIAPDGGLYVPKQFPLVSLEAIAALTPLGYAERATRILSLLLDDYTQEEIAKAAHAAYGSRFDGPNPAPLTPLNGNTSLLELYHGPTLAFKDMALQILPHLLSMAAKKNGMHLTDASSRGGANSKILDHRGISQEMPTGRMCQEGISPETQGDEICILVATSGDTGKAALEGFCDVPGTRCAVFYPKDGVSRAQYLQMASQGGENTHVIAVDGNFDDAQTGVKHIFSDPDLAVEMQAQGRILTSANSINYGRLVPQVVYYFSAYADLLACGAIQLGDSVNFVVPTGNFGNILAAVYAKRMGLPVGKLMCASNANRVLADFIHSGAYDINRSFHKTHSPSMDILISSNLERYLFELSGRDAGQIKRWMQQLSEKKRYTISKEQLKTLRGDIYGGWISDAEAQDTILRLWRESNVVIDPHTAVAAALLSRYRGEVEDKTQTVLVGTASPYKFGRSVARALGINEPDEFKACRLLCKMTGMPYPAQISTLENATIRHTASCRPDTMRAALLEAFAADT